MLIENIKIPLEIDDRFVPPDLQKALDYYPKYITAGGTWTFSSFLCYILEQIDTIKPEGSTGHQIYTDFVLWIGGPRAFESRYGHVNSG